MLKKMKSYQDINDADTELNFLREALDNNIDKQEFQQKLESKFKIQKNMFSDVVRNLGGIVSSSNNFDQTQDKDKDPKNEIDNILQNIEEKHGQI